MQLSVMPYHTEDFDKFIASLHYLGYTPAGARLRLGILQDGIKIIGALMWGRPSSRELDQEQILELTRMVFIDDTESMVESHGLALARKHIRKHFPLVKLLLAYSDTEQGHTGTVYRADNWVLLGKAKGHNWARGYIIEQEWRVHNPVFDKRGEKSTTKMLIRPAKAVDELELMASKLREET